MKTIFLIIFSVISTVTIAQEEVKSIIKNDDTQQLKTFLTKHDINQCHKIKNSTYNLLALSIKYNSRKVFDYLIKDDAIHLEATCAGKTALMYAAKYGRIEMVKELLDNGASIDTETSKGRTAMDYAIKYEQASVARLLKEFKR